MSKCTEGYKQGLYSMYPQKEAEEIMRALDNLFGEDCAPNILKEATKTPPCLFNYIMDKILKPNYNKSGEGRE